MEAKVELLEKNEDNPSFSKDLKPEVNVKGSDYAIDQMLYILGGYILAPTPLPNDLISLWSEPDIDKSQPCEYCSYSRSKIAFPNVEVDLKGRIIRFVSLKRACDRCYNIINLKTLLSVIIGSFQDKKEKFNKIYAHFMKVNRLNESEGTEHGNKESVDIRVDKNLIFQDLVSMAYSLKVIMRMRKSNMSVSIIKRVKLVDYGHFKGSEFTLKREGSSSDLMSSKGLGNKSAVGVSKKAKSRYDDDSSVNRIINNLSMDFTRRVTSSIRGMIDRLISNNIDRISIRDMLELIVSLRMCKSLSEPVAYLCLKRMNGDVVKSDRCGEDDFDNMLKIALELVEYKIIDVHRHRKILKHNMNEQRNSCKFSEEDVQEDGSEKEVEIGCLRGMINFLCENMKRMAEISETMIFRLIPIFYAIFTQRVSEVDGTVCGLKSSYGCYVSELTNKVLKSRIFVDLMDDSVDSGNVLSKGGIRSLNDCNRVIDVLKLNVINSDYEKKYLSTDCTNSNDKNNNMTTVTRLREYVLRDIYRVAVENISKFTSKNIVEMIGTVRRLEEPYPTNLVNSVINIYVKHIAQYSIDNMITLLEELSLMKIRSEKAMLNTLVCLPRKVTTVDSFEHVIRLLQVYEGYESEYLNILMEQQIQQIYYKINPKYFKVGSSRF